VLAGVRSHIYSYGHRNAQGLVFGPEGRLYASEQGPKTVEVNLITAGGNYGWHRVAGFRDDKSYV
jgi:glucose/arabinose dehydrogenase